MNESPIATDSSSTTCLKTGCCIAGGGPAGLMLGYLLARAGVEVTVLEKHADFLRDFRGDTIHPSTLDVMHELGLLDEFLKLPHTRLYQATARVEGREFTLADFSGLPVRCPYIAMMPQWDFLNFLAERAAQFPNFRLLMSTEATGLLVGGEGIIGARARNEGETLDIYANLTISADGRNSVLRNAAGLSVRTFGAPMDVFWLRLPRREQDAGAPLFNIGGGCMFITIDRGDYWQCAYVIPKGKEDEIRGQGLEAFRRRLAAAAPQLAEAAQALRSLDDVKLLTVRLDRLRDWARPGFLVIGDAAHAMSPVGGVGVNLAIQDAVAAANLLGAPLLAGAPSLAQLQAVQKRRLWPVMTTQWAQRLIQDRIIGRALTPGAGFRPPLVFYLLDAWPVLRRFPARAIGYGARPEQVLNTGG